MNNDQFEFCVAVLRTAYPENTPFVVPARMDSPSYLSFTVDAHAHGVITIEGAGFRLWLQAFYGEGQAETVSSPEEIPDAIHRLYRELFGPMKDADDSQRSKAPEEVESAEALYAEWVKLTEKSKSERVAKEQQSKGQKNRHLAE